MALKRLLGRLSDDFKLAEIVKNLSLGGVWVAGDFRFS